MTRQRFAINNDIKMRECGCCFEMLPFSAFTMTKEDTPRTHCKKCRSQYVARKQLENKIERYPLLYADCEGDECDHIFRRALKKCPRCGTGLFNPSS